MKKSNYTYDNFTTSTDGIQRSQERIKKNGEVFTPDSIIQKMMDMVDDPNIWHDPTKTFLDPTCGSGNIILAMITRRLNNGLSPKVVLSTTFGVELMQDNVDKCKERIRVLLGSEDAPCHDYDDILDKNIVCHDFFDWDFENWRPKVPKTKQLF